MTEVIILSVVLVSLVLIRKLEKKARRERVQAANLAVTVQKGKNPTRNVYRIRNIYTVLEQSGYSESKLASFEDELQRRLVICEEQCGTAPKNLKEAESMVHNIKRYI